MWQGERTRDEKGRFVDEHGLSQLPEHSVWMRMKQRILNPNNHAYRNYGGRGIDIDPRWIKSFVSFYEDMGPRPSDKHSLDRIDNDGGYWSDNCRWTTHEEQMRNRSNNVTLTYNGQTKTVSEWAHEYGHMPQSVFGRLERGWSIESALLTPNQWRRIENDVRDKIRQLYASSKWTKVALARRFGINRSSIYRILAEV